MTQSSLVSQDGHLILGPENLSSPGSHCPGLKLEPVCDPQPLAQPCQTVSSSVLSPHLPSPTTTTACNYPGLVHGVPLTCAGIVGGRDHGWWIHPWLQSLAKARHAADTRTSMARRTPAGKAFPTLVPTASPGHSHPAPPSAGNPRSPSLLLLFPLPGMPQPNFPCSQLLTPITAQHRHHLLCLRSPPPPPPPEPQNPTAQGSPSPGKATAQGSCTPPWSCNYQEVLRVVAVLGARGCAEASAESLGSGS